MVITPSGMVMLVRDVQQESAPSPIDVTLLGIMMLVRDDHWNALSSMDVTPSGMMILTDLHHWNALSPMAVTTCPSSVSGMDSSDAEPVYLAIAAVPSGWRV